MQISGYLSTATLMERKLPFYVASIGHPKQQPAVHRPLGIEDCQILYTVSGGGCCFINGQTFEVSARDIIFLPIDTPHEYHNNNDWETMYITFNGCGLKDFFDLEASVYHTDKSFDFVSEFQELLRFSGNPELYKETSIKLYSFLLSLREHITSGSAENDRKEHIMTRALHYMSDNREISLSDIAEKFNISEEYFCRMFKEYTGFRPFEYINLIKIQKAKELLKSTDFTIGEISSVVGYESHSYFSMLFKRYTGITPGEYRTK